MSVDIKYKVFRRRTALVGIMGLLVSMLNCNGGNGEVSVGELEGPVGRVKQLRAKGSTRGCNSPFVRSPAATTGSAKSK